MIRTIHATSRRQQRKAFQSRVWLNDVEVTSDCQFADDRRGVVLLLKRTEGRAFMVANGQVAKEWRHGRVVIGRRARSIQCPKHRVKVKAGWACRRCRAENPPPPPGLRLGEPIQIQGYWQ